MYKYFKIIIDTLLSLISIAFLSPIYIIISLILLILNRENPLFIQKRTGKNFKIFNVFKFKTMNSKRDKQGMLLSDKDRITKFGKFLRDYSIDELPQLINVLKGDMSLIGPRPLLPKYDSLYSEKQKKRFRVKPGVTGWCQINGRNNMSWAKKFNFDIWYVENCSFMLDLKIIFKTIGIVLFKRGVSLEGQATTVTFNGKN